MFIHYDAIESRYYTYIIGIKLDNDLLLNSKYLHDKLGKLPNWDDSNNKEAINEAIGLIDIFDKENDPIILCGFNNKSKNLNSLPFGWEWYLCIKTTDEANCIKLESYSNYLFNLNISLYKDKFKQLYRDLGHNNECMIQIYDILL